MTRERWQVDSSQSTLRFSLRHMVISEIRGELPRWGGELLLDPEDLSRSRVEVWVDLPSIETGDAERDQQLRSAEFLDVARFPRARFVSTKIEPERDDRALLIGRLELHGVAQTIELALAKLRVWTDAGQRCRGEYQVRGTIDRQAFGLHWNQDLDIGGIVVGDKVEIEARVQVVRRADALDRWSASGP